LKQTNKEGNNVISNANRDTTAVVVVFFEDITHEAYLQRLEELNLYKMKMLSSISHELKTPLNCSMGMLEELTAFV
jgi:K+-sensing histidine kinase KdpD